MKKKSYKQRMNQKARALKANQKLRRTTARCRRVAGGFQYKPAKRNWGK